MAYDTAGLRARAHGLAKWSRDTNLYRGRGAAFWFVIQRAAWLAMGRDTKFCIVAEGGDSRSRYSAARAAIRCLAPCNTAQERCNTHGRRTTQPRSLRYGARRHRATIRPSQACDTAQCARRLGQGGVHCALSSILTQCTVLSHCLGHCS